jgi:hypothetical protein
MTRHPDPIEDYAATLATALHGPARAKARMVQEMRDGLEDAVAAYTSEGMPYERAVRRAVREFGTADELAPNCQRELSIAQARHTARAVLLTAPFLFACWNLFWAIDQNRGWQPLPAAQFLAGITVVTALLAAAALAATGPLSRWLPTPNHLPQAIAWTGTTSSVAMPFATLALATTSTNWPLIALAGVLTAASHGMVAASARACRQCARLPIT